MKKHALTLIVALSVIVLLSSCKKPATREDRIIGEWKGAGKGGATVSWVFYEDGELKLATGGQNPWGTGRKMTWSIDSNHDPMHLDLAVIETMPAIVRFITDTKIQLRQPASSPSRPVAFSETDTEGQIVLKRVGEKSAGKSPEKLIVGEWEGTEKGKAVSFIFNENGIAKMVENNVVIDGRWSIDSNRDPMHLDLTVIGPMPAIVRFITDTKIQLRVGDPRPIGFSQSDTDKQFIFTLTKQ